MQYGSTVSNFQDIKWICTDCFDTLIHRICSSEEVLNFFFEQAAPRLGVSSVKFKAVWDVGRKAVKADSKIRQIEEPSFHDLANELYIRVNALLNGEALFSAEEFEKIVYDTMLEVEADVIIINDSLVSWLLEQKSKGRKVVCISDFYMSGKWLERLFEKKGLENLFDEIFISSDFGQRKSTGNLYEYVAGSLGSSFQQMYMLGDNQKSDYEIPKKMGIHAELYREEYIKLKLLECQRKLQNIYERNTKAHYPFCNYSFSLYLFCERLHRSLKESSLSDVWFFSREGMVLKRLFEEYLKLQCDENIQCHYLYVSRQATFLPSLHELDEEDFYLLQSVARDFSIYEFLISLGINNERLKNLSAKYDFKKAEKNFLISSVFENLKKEPEFVRVYEEERVKARRLAVSYYHAQGLFLDENQPYAIVDIGWKGSIQDCLSRIVENRYRIKGFYYGLTGNVKVENHNTKTGLVFEDFPVKSPEFEVFSINYRMLERLLCANHGGCVGYEANEPVLKEFEEAENELFSYVALFQENLIQDIEDIDRVFKETCSFGESEQIKEKLITRMHRLFCVDITKDRITQMNYMNARMDFNFASFGTNRSSNGIKSMTRQLLTGRNKTAIIQKIEFQLYRMKLGGIAECVRLIARSRVK